MNILNIEHVHKVYGEKVIFDDISLGIQEGEKIGIIGINGTGKSTLLKIVAGQEEPDEGQIVRQNGRSIAYLPQNPRFLPGETVMSYTQEVDENWRVQSILNKLGITEYGELLENLSGGQRRKVALAKVLASDFDILLLDEPTNHLDDEMISWLEEYLKEFKGVVLMVTHDRYFLDRIVTRIFAFEENGAIRQYEGGYTDYVKKRPASTENSFDGKTKSHAGNKEAHMAYKNREKKLKFSYQEQREYETIEEDISVLETTIETLDQEMAENGTDYVKLRELSEKKDEAEEQLMEKMERWEYLEELAEKIANQ